MHPALRVVLAYLTMGALLLVGCGGSGSSDTFPGADGGSSSGTSGTSGASGSSGTSGSSGSSGSGCVARTCAAAGATCGTISDGCGGTLACGTCGTDQTCGGGGTANVCGYGVCTPKTCASLHATCGSASDGCANVLSCGTCQPGETCGAGGPNVCGAGACTPTTCAAQKKNCGVISDGCAASLTCGTCSGTDVCGAGGVANVCGPACPLGCPTGYTCNAQGVCAGGSPTGLVLDVKTHTVSGTVTLNGAQPTSACGSTDRASVRFDETTKGYHFAIPVPCNGATTPFTFTGLVYPGTYSVSVVGGLSSLPNVPFLVNPSLVVQADIPGLLYDVKTFAVAGTVTLNGAQPTSACGSSDRASIHLDEATKGYHFAIPVPCNGATTPFTFTGLVYPGTYSVAVVGGLSSVPNVPFLVNPSLVVQADVPGLVYDVKTYTVAGTVTLNGAQPTSACGSTDRASLRFDETTKGYHFAIPVPCNGATTPFTFTGLLYPGTYSVSVVGGLSSLPNVAYLVNPSLVVQADIPGLLYDVKTYTLAGTVTLNGAQPTSACGSTDRGSIRLDETTKGYHFAIPIPCNGATTPFTFTGLVYPGTYSVSVVGGLSSLPNVPFLVNPSLVVQADIPGIAYDVKTFTVSGAVTLNGAQPTSACGSTDRASVRFDETTKGYHFAIPVPCNGATTPFTFTGLVYPGTYSVSVVGGLSSLPNVPFLVNPSLVVQADAPGLAYDVKTLTVSGTVTLNGAQPTSACGSTDRASVRFDEPSKSYHFAIPVPCNGATTPFAFTGLVYPGTYRISVVGGLSNLPNVPYEIVDLLQIP